MKALMGSVIRVGIPVGDGDAGARRTVDRATIGPRPKACAAKRLSALTAAAHYRGIELDRGVSRREQLLAERDERRCAGSRSVDQRLRVGGARVDAERGEVGEDPARQRAVDLAGQQAELLGLGVARARRRGGARRWSGNRSTAPGAAGSTSCGSPRWPRARRTSRGGSRRGAARCRPSRTAARAPARGRPRTPPRRPACRARTRSPACGPTRSRPAWGAGSRTRTDRSRGRQGPAPRAHARTLRGGGSRPAPRVRPSPGSRRGRRGTPGPRPGAPS